MIAAGPSIVTLHKIASGLAIPLQDLFRPEETTLAGDQLFAASKLHDFVAEAGPEGEELLVRLARLLLRMSGDRRSG